MKVTGTGNPAALTLRLREREVAGLKEELGHWAAVADDAEAADARSDPLEALLFNGGRTPRQVLNAVTALLDHLAITKPNDQGRVVVSGRRGFSDMRSVERRARPLSGSWPRSSGSVRERYRPTNCGMRSRPPRRGARR